MFVVEREISGTGFILRYVSGIVKPISGITWCRVYYAPTFIHLMSPDFYPGPLPVWIQNAVNGRKADFYAGRYAASKALQAAEVSNIFVGSTAQGIPVWPNGWRGSITHTGEIALAVAGRRSDVEIIGVDCEYYSSDIAKEISDSVLTAEEKNYLLTLNMSFLLATMIVFSGKESLYKALWPDVRHFFDFSAAKIFLIDVKEKMFFMRLTETLSEHWTKGTTIRGHFIFENHYITTIIMQ